MAKVTLPPDNTALNQSFVSPHQPGASPMHIYYVTMKCGSDQWLETVFAHDIADAIEQADLRDQ